MFDDDRDRTILIVDDEEDICEILCSVFSDANFNVLKATSGNQALKLLEIHDVDVVLSDIRMSDGNGIELLEKIKSKNLEKPQVYLMTGQANVTVADVMLKGGEALFFKPISFHNMIEVISGQVSDNKKYTMRRKHPRVEVDLEVTMDTEWDTQIVGIAKSLSIGGMFIFIDDPELIRKMSSDKNKFTVRLFSKKGEFKPFTGECLCRWVRTESSGDRPTGIGVEFIKTDQRSMNNVAELINAVKTMG